MSQGIDAIVNGTDENRNIPFWPEKHALLVRNSAPEKFGKCPRTSAFPHAALEIGATACKPHHARENKQRGS